MPVPVRGRTSDRPFRRVDQTKSLVTAVRFIVGPDGRQLAAAVEQRYDKRHMALLESGLKLPLLSVLYAPGDELGRSTRQAIARAAGVAELPPALFKALFDKVDAAAPSKDVTAEVVALRQSVLTHLGSRPPAAGAVP